jgi:hypothetical protein
VVVVVVVVVVVEFLAIEKPFYISSCVLNPWSIFDVFLK